MNTLQWYRAINAGGEEVSRFTAASIMLASEKLKLRFGRQHYFLRLEPIGKPFSIR